MAGRSWAVLPPRLTCPHPSAHLPRSSLRLQNSTIEGYKKIVRNHVTPYLGTIRLDKLAATRIASHYRQLETTGRRDKPGYGKPLSANTVSKVHVLLGAMLDAASMTG